ncbi:DEAD/DEAH box helicase, partial [Deferribacter abyssi]|uniref:DEAD/DEAH box helicase n=1 Tax=Deferribacter abyssi TaxID=213806 RepID=UPI003C1BF43A
YCHNLDEVVSKSEYGQIFVAKTTMFSHIKLNIPEEDKSNKKEIAKKALKKGIEYREQLKNKYDLLIVDEAHYYRNFHGDSLRVNVAKGFFGTRIGENSNAENEGIASKVLLITATPNHSKQDDIKNIFNYFNYLNLKVNNKLLEKCNDYSDILKEYAHRRFRRLEDKIKYQYRKETAIEASFEEDLKAETFFAVYQKHLVRKILRKEEEEHKEKKKQNISENRLTFGYLEGCEIISYEEDNNAVENSENDIESQDYTRGLDHEILKNIVKKYTSIFQKPPSHPKYDKIVNNIIEKERDAINYGKEAEKNIIFVRRIPSVKELTERLLREYDKILFEKLTKNLKLPKNLKMPNKRKELDNLIKKHFPEFAKKENNLDFEISEVNDDSNFKNCVVLDYFVRKKEQQSSTLGSNFRNLLVDPNSPFSMLFELPPNKEEPTEKYVFEDFLINKRNEIDYLESAKRQRYKNSYKLLKYQNIKNYSNSKSAKREFDTLWTLFFKQNKEAKQLIDSFSEYEWEGLGNFTKKALIFASDAIIELFCWYLVNENKNNYESFIETIKKDFKKSRTYLLMKESLNYFKYIWQKVLGLKKEMLPDYDFRIFESGVPVYGFHGATKSDTIIQLFNTPFYPNNIVATSVLQEGVNLHYYCNNIIHYGIAWTQGADEQRNGRVDRFLGKVHRKLKANRSNLSAMNICYPVLKDSVDELQVSQFIKYKRRAEAIIDKGEEPEEVTEIDNKFESNWKAYLREPNNDISLLEDPYPARFEINKSDLIDINCFKSDKQKIYGKNIVTSILDYFEKHQNINRIKIEKIIEFWSENNPTSKLFYLNTTISNKDQKRYQPAIVFCGYLPLSSVNGFEKKNFNFYLKVVSPVAKKKDVFTNKDLFEKKIKTIKKLLINYPLVKIEIDDEKTGFEYLSCCSYILVTFDSDGNVFLDENELKYSVEQTLYVADELEKILYDENTDEANFEELSVMSNSETFGRIVQSQNGTNQSENLNSTVYFGNKIYDNILNGWSEFERDNLKYVCKSVSIPYPSKLGSVDCIKMLSKYPFINYHFNNNKIIIKLNYLKDNFQKEEQKFLENWFEVAASYIEKDFKDINNSKK